LKSGATSGSGALRTIEAKAGSLELGMNSSAAGLVVAQSVGLKTPPDPAIDRNFEHEVKVASTVRSPVSSQGSDPEFPADLILSPEPTLTEGLSRPKTRSLPSYSVMSTDGISRIRLPHSW